MAGFANAAPMGINEPGARAFLDANGWPRGLQDSLLSGMNRIPYRYFICDDSGSMVTSDGRQLVGSGANCRLANCSRWAELSDALKFHGTLSDKLGVMSEFRFLNGRCIRVGHHAAVGDNLPALLQELQKNPGGGTPLCEHIRSVIFEIAQLAPQLRAAGQKVCLVIATDGESSDGDLAAAMKPLEHLPVWVVVRLCTNQESIVNYWSQIDSQLELDMDVLDDLKGEADEVHKLNPWLTYGLPLHRLREFGVPLKELDLLDEQALSKDQMRSVASIVLGGTRDEYPHPETDQSGFAKKVKSMNKTTWSPVHGTMKPWIRPESHPSNASCSIM